MADAPSPLSNPEDFLTPEEREAVRRLLRDPSEFPREFGAWVTQYMDVNGELSKSQVAGLARQTRNLTPQIDSVATTESTNSGSYTNLATTGPELTELLAGTYLVLFGANMVGPTNHNQYMSLSVNGAAASDGDAVYFGTAAAGTIQVSLSRAILVVLTEPKDNTILCKYRTDGTTCFFLNRWITAVRVA